MLLILLLTLAPLGANAALAVKEIKSPKGITAWLQEDKALPIVAIAFAWRGGFESDPEDKQGLSTLATDMLTHGAGSYDDNAVQEILQRNSISLSFDARRDSITGGIRFLKETMPQAVDLLRASVNAPRFDKDALDRQKAKTISRMKFNLTDPDWLLSRLVMREGFAGHPYNKRALGTMASVQAITPEDLQAWRKRFNRGGLLVTATGAISEAELGALLDNVFGELPETVAIPPVPEAEWKAGGKTFALKLPGPQAQMMMEWPGLKRKDKDWYAGEVLDYILGGGSFSSRLMKEIREKRGLTYGVSSDQSPLDHAAIFTVQASFQGKNAGEVVKLALAEVKRMTDAQVSNEELQAAKDYLIGAYPLQLTSSTAIAGHLLSLRLKDLPVDEEARRAAAIQAITKDDVQRVAKKIFGAAPALFMVGAPEGVAVTNPIDTLD